LCSVVIELKSRRNNGKVAVVVNTDGAYPKTQS